MVAKKEKKVIWFRAKQYGWGWYPATWEGWAVMLGYIVIVFAGTFILETNPHIPFAMTFFPFVALFTAILIFTCYYTGEKPEWRWGGKPMFKQSK